MLLSFAWASFTVLPKSRSRTLNRTVPRNIAFSELIIGGPSVRRMSATALSGMEPNSIVCIGSLLSDSRLFLKSWPYLAFTEKRCRPSTVVVSFIPPSALSTTAFTSSTLRPYLPISSRFTSISTYFPPVMGSTYMSFIPSIPVSSFLIFSERTAILSRFCPYTFTPTSVLIPVESILIRLEIGMVQPLVTPGICSLAFSSLMRSSFVLPSRHSLCGFNKIMVSIMEMGELSVAVLALPAFPRT